MLFWPGLQTRFIAYFRHQNWTNRKIAFVAILIAVSVAFVLVMTSVLPFLVWPSLKMAIGGLPVKLTGYVFGPIIGALTGILSDSITFAFRPTYWHWSYLLTFALMGLIPGLVGYVMNRRWRTDGKFESAMVTHINKTNLIFTIMLLCVIIAGFATIVVFFGDQFFKEDEISKIPVSERPLISSRWVFLAVAVSGLCSMLVGIFIMMFFLKKKTLNAVLPIIAFSALIEVITTPLISYGDVSVLSTSRREGFITVVTTHFLTSPVKIWINLAVIYTAFRVVSPLISARVANGWT